MEKQQNMSDGRKWLFSFQFLTVTFLSLLMTCCLQMTVSALPKYVVHLGIGESLAGISTTACTIASLVFRPTAARMADEHGGKRTAIQGTIIYITVFVLYFICNSMMLLLLLRVLQGFGMSMITTALGTIATGIVPKEEITRGMSYYSLGNAVALSVGPAMGLWLVEYLGFEGMFAFGAGASFLAVVLLLFFKNDKKVAVKRNVTENCRKLSFIKKAKESGAVFPSAILVFLILCQTSLSTYLSFYMDQLQISGAGIFFTLNVFGMITSKFILGKACEQFGNFKVSFVSGVLLTSSYLIVAFSSSLGMNGIIAAGILYGFGYGGLYSLLNVAAVKHADADNTGTANSLFFGAKDVGTAIGSVAWGAIFTVGFFSMYFIAAVCIVVATAAFLYLIVCGNKAERKDEQHE